MAFKRFSILLSLRICLVILNLAVSTWLLYQAGYHATSLLSLMLLAGQIFELLAFINKTNHELARFFEAMQYSDLTQRFSYQQFGSGFEQLGNTFTQLLQELQQKNEDQEQTVRHLKSLVEQAPVPLISLHRDDKLTQWNHSARRLFGHYQVQRLTDLSLFGAALPHQLKQLNPGEHQLVSFEVDGMSHQLALSATQLSIGGQQEKLISLQDIRSELDTAQLQAWQDLVRVLTHEIMNSITPVASLADTSSELIQDIQRQHKLSPELQEELQDVQDAVQTLSRRSNSLMQFVGSYRRLAKLPAPQFKQVKLQEIFNQVCELHKAQDKQINTRIRVEPSNLGLHADANMLEQVLINLLQNASQALEQTQQPQIELCAYLNRRNHVVIEVKDNGPGIEQEILDKVLVPFFTSKKNGSGVGLALTHQVMIAHGGNIKVNNNKNGGACFILTF